MSKSHTRNNYSITSTNGRPLNVQNCDKCHGRQLDVRPPKFVDVHVPYEMICNTTDFITAFF